MPERLIDVPIETLPFVDEHSIEVDARVDQVWDALLAVMGNFGGRPARPIARGLGCLPIERSPRFGDIGTTVPGFIVTRAVPPAVLALMGEHRYSRYALIFRIAAEQPNGRLPRLSAETRAEFPGRAGRDVPGAGDRNPRPRAGDQLHPPVGPPALRTDGVGGGVQPLVQTSAPSPLATAPRPIGR